MALQPGDLCRLLGDHKVEHYSCDEFADGVITNCVTGEVVFVPEGRSALDTLNQDWNDDGKLRDSVIGLGY